MMTCPAKRDQASTKKGATDMKGLKPFLLTVVCIPILAMAEQQPPVVRPFMLPTFNDLKKNFQDTIPPLKKTPIIDEDKLFQAILNCYPTKSLFGLDVTLKAGANLSNSKSNSLSMEDDSFGIGSHYAGIIFEMPLYSTTENDRERERESARRQNVAQTISSFEKSFSGLNRAIRERGLNMALEKRSQVRVKKGIASITEQVGYLEKVLNAEGEVEKYKADMTAARLTLVGYCREEERRNMNNYLLSLVKKSSKEQYSGLKLDIGRLGGKKP